MPKRRANNRFTLPSRIGCARAEREHGRSLPPSSGRCRATRAIAAASRESDRRVARDDRCAAAMQIARARVVAEPAPQRQHFIRAAPRRAPGYRENAEETLVIRDDRRDLRLLQHDFRQPDAIGSRVFCHGRSWRPCFFASCTTLAAKGLRQAAAPRGADLRVGLAAKQPFELVLHLVLHLRLDFFFFAFDDRLRGARCHAAEIDLVLRRA